MNDQKFNLVSDYKPSGDQPDAIKNILSNIDRGSKEQLLLGVTGSGKTFTMANVIAKANRPTLVLAHNKILAAQLCAEFKDFFPDNVVEYFVSYFDYYQPEAYIPQKDLYIEKDSQVNDEIDRLRHSATRSLFTRRDVIVVASVSCIYGLGTPEDYLKGMKIYRVSQDISMKKLMTDLIEIGYERNDIGFERGRFRLRGDVLELYLVYENSIVRIEFFGNEIDSISIHEPVSMKKTESIEAVNIFPATHFLTFPERIPKIIERISTELSVRLSELRSEGKDIEANRLESRTLYDMEMIQEIGYCKGIENYSSHLEGRMIHTPPKTLVDYFPEDFLLIVDESHATLPQVRGMYAGDQSRKSNLVEHGFRLPSALDNRPLNFKEFNERLNQVIYVSATPAEYELGRTAVVDQKLLSEQVIRPTGLLDPEIEVVPTENQIDDIINNLRTTISNGFRALLITLTKKMSEELSEYLTEMGFRVRYMHSDIETLERIEIIRGLRSGEFDVLVGINLLREGLDIPEVSMIAILDSDKEGFLRNERTLIQIIGRAARNAEGKVWLYADRITGSMSRAIAETSRRRNLQIEHNKKYNITPKTVIKDVKFEAKEGKTEEPIIDLPEFIHPEDLPRVIGRLTKDMKKAADEYDFERAAFIRDKISDISMKT